MAYDWQWANDFLSRGRKKYERPLYDRGLRIWKTNKWDVNSDINVGWKYSRSSTTFITYHKDGTITIQGNQQPTHWGGSWTPLRSQSTRLTIHRYAGIRVLQRNFKFYLEEDDAPLTPAKIQGCRKCKQSGRLDSWCYPSTCWDSNNADKKQCPTHPDAVLRLGSSWHYVPCEHGETDGHTVINGQQCYSCGGTTKRDYGSKPERMLWTGTPLRLRDGKVIKSAASQLERMIADNVEFVIS